MKNTDDMPHPLVLSLASVGADEERHLRNLLALLKSYLEPQWCLAGRLGDFPDAVLVDMDTPEGRQVWENVDFSEMPRVALSRDRVLGAEWTLIKPIRPGGPHSVTEVLTSVAGKLQLSDPARAETVSRKMRFAELARKAYHKTYAADVVLPTGSVLVIDSAKQVFYSSRTSDELVALLRNRRRLDGKVIPVEDPAQMAARLARWGIRPRPLEQLLWLTGLVAGGGESLGGWDPHEPVRLTKWPDFTSLPYRQVHLKMAAMLKDSEALPSEVAKACEVALGDVADFLNACAEIGILEARGAARDPLTPESSMKTTVMDAWRSVVGSFKSAETD
jgi:hypothetical protein